MRHAPPLLALLGLLAPARADAGACAPPQLPPMALTPAKSALAKGGGIVMSVEDAAKPPAYKFASGGVQVPPVVRPIGAGLVVLVPPDAGDWTLQDGKG